MRDSKPGGRSLASWFATRENALLTIRVIDGRCLYCRAITRAAKPALAGSVDPDQDGRYLPPITFWLGVGAIILLVIHGFIARRQRAV